MSEIKKIKFEYTPESVFNKYYQALCYFAFQYVKNDNIAEDIVQNLFISLIENKNKFESVLHLKNYLYQFVKNSCLNSIKKNKSHNRYINFKENSFQYEEDYERKIITTEIYKEINEVIDSLPPQCSKIYKLCYFKEMSNYAIAENLGISINTVKAQKARGKRILKNQLKNLYPIFIFFLGMLK